MTTSTAAAKKAAKKKKATSKNSVAAKPTVAPANFSKGDVDRVIGLLDAIDGKLALISDFVLEQRNPVEERIDCGNKARLKLEIDTTVENAGGDTITVDQKGDLVTSEVIAFTDVVREAQILCDIEKETTKGGFHRARSIISTFGVGKIKDLPESKYAEIVGKFREEVSNWRS